MRACRVGEVASLYPGWLDAAGLDAAGPDATGPDATGPDAARPGASDAGGAKMSASVTPRWRMKPCRRVSHFCSTGAAPCTLSGSGALRCSFANAQPASVTLITSARLFRAFFCIPVSTSRACCNAARTLASTGGLMSCCQASPPSASSVQSSMVCCGVSEALMRIRSPVGCAGGGKPPCEFLPRPAPCRSGLLRSTGGARHSR